MPMCWATGHVVSSTATRVLAEVFNTARPHSHEPELRKCAEQIFFSGQDENLLLIHGIRERI